MGYQKFTCEKVARAVGLEGESRQSGEIKFLCPVHNDNTPSLSINPEKGAWKCHPCDAGGNAWASSLLSMVGVTGH